MRKPWIVIIVALLPLFIACGQQEVSSLEGSMYLPGDGRLVELSGEWEFYWEQLYTPQDFSSGNTIAADMLPVPDSWTNHKDAAGNTYPAYGQATYRLSVDLEEPLTDAGLLIPKIWCASKVWVNGRLVSERGRLDKEYYQNMMVEMLVPIGEVSHLEIVIQVANYSLFVSGMVEAPEFGPFETLNYRMSREDSLNLLWIGMVLVMALYHFVLYFYNSKQKTPLYFALFCVLIVIKLIVFADHNIYEYLKLEGWLSFRWQSAWYFSSTYLILGVGMLYIKSLYPREINARVARVFLILTTLYALFLIIMPLNVYLPTVQPFQIVVVAGGAYLVWVIILATLRKRRDANLQAAGVAVMVFAALNDALHSFGIELTSFPEFVPIGFGIFLSLQFVINAKRFSNAFTSLERLSASLEEKVIERTAEVTLQKEEIERQNEKIRSSINYAKRIQSALLPQKEFVQFLFEESFIFYKPRDVVSGDFYFVDEIKNDQEHYRFFSAIDCTGHGVPGAFMSMIGDTLLYKIIRDEGLREPDLILEALHFGIRTALKQATTDNQDGMDMAFVVVDVRRKRLHFAGATNPMVYIQDGELQFVKGDRRHVGGKHLREPKPFVCHTIQLDRPTWVYLFTDGFPDQFGGPDHQKFMTKRLREHLFEQHQRSFEEQHDMLSSTLEAWVGEERQIDDILVMGVKIDLG